MLLLKLKCCRKKKRNASRMSRYPQSILIIIVFVSFLRSTCFFFLGQSPVVVVDSFLVDRTKGRYYWKDCQRRRKIYTTSNVNILCYGASSVCYNSLSNNNNDYFEEIWKKEEQQQQQELRPPIPSMPSDLFQQMAKSQLELLANSLFVNGGSGSSSSDQQQQQQSSSSSSNTIKKVKSMALYLPQENSITGQLEFTPAVIYPDPKTERVFIASDADSGIAPTLPKTLTKLPGFSHAATLIPGYPMLNAAASIQPGVGVVEEVLCDVRSPQKAAALSVPLLSGSQTVGVLLVSPSSASASSTTTTTRSDSDASSSWWTAMDKEQVSRAAQSLSMALSMDNERKYLREQNTKFRDGLSDSLHQVKNPLQALRTYGKILQRQIADAPIETTATTNNTTTQPYMQSQRPISTPLPELVARLMVQSDRVVDLIGPMDSLLNSLDDDDTNYLALMPATETIEHEKTNNIVKWKELPPSSKPSWENETIDFSRSEEEESSNGTIKRFRSTNFDDELKQQQEAAATQQLVESVDHFGLSNSTIAPPANGGSTMMPSPKKRKKKKRKGNGANGATSPPQQQQQQQQQQQEESQLPSSSSSTSFQTSSSYTTVVGELELEMAFLGDVLDPIFSAYEAIAIERDIKFDIIGKENFDELPGVVVSPRYAQEAVSNVLDNAFKYCLLPKPRSPFIKNPSPHVRVRLVPNNNVVIADSSPSDAPPPPGVTLFVEDNGPGISHEERESVFYRGYRSEKTKSVKGTGIGLDISQTLMQRMKATLSVVVPNDDQNNNSPSLYDNDDDEGFLDGAVLKFQFFRSPPPQPPEM